MSNQSVTYLVGACLGVFGLAAFCTLVLAPAITAYRRPLERVAVVVLSLYVLAALIGRRGPARGADHPRVAAPLLSACPRTRARG